MNLLIITEAIDNSAAGKVFKSILKELQRNNGIEIFVIANQIDNDISAKISSIQLNKASLKNSRFFKLIFTLSYFDLEGYSRIKSGKSAFKSVYKTFKPDVILVFAAGYLFSSIDLGYKLSRIYKIPFAAHLVDPMPSTEGWNEHPLLRNAIKKYVGKRLRRAKFLSYTNQKMLDYQLAMHEISCSTKTKVIYNPAQYVSSIGAASEKRNKFLYIGSLYNKRQPNELIKAFLNYLPINSEAELLFVGSKNTYSHLIPEKYADKITFIDWTDNPEHFITIADVLIDIDADIENDVFISSKLINYLMFDKPILAISPHNSPATDFLNMCKETVFFCVNTSYSIFDKLMEINSMGNEIKIYAEREKLRSDLKVENITSMLIKELENLNKSDSI